MCCEETYKISPQEIFEEKERLHHFTPLDDTLSPITDMEVDFTPRYIRLRQGLRNVTHKITISGRMTAALGCRIPALLWTSILNKVGSRGQEAGGRRQVTGGRSQ